MREYAVAVKEGAMLAAFDLEELLGWTGVVALVFGFLLGAMNRWVKLRALNAAKKQAEAIHTALSTKPPQIQGLIDAGVQLPKPEDIKAILEALPAEDRAVGAFIIGALAVFILALVAGGFVSLSATGTG
jgi:hypothetical protein